METSHLLQQIVLRSLCDRNCKKTLQHLSQPPPHTVLGILYPGTGPGVSEVVVLLLEAGSAPLPAQARGLQGEALSSTFHFVGGTKQFGISGDPETSLPQTSRDNVT